MTDIPLMFFEGTEIYLYCNHFTKRIQLLDKVSISFSLYFAEYIPSVPIY